MQLVLKMSLSAVNSEGAEESSAHSFPASYLSLPPRLAVFFSILHWQGSSPGPMLLTPDTHQGALLPASLCVFSLAPACHSMPLSRTLQVKLNTWFLCPHGQNEVACLSFSLKGYMAFRNHNSLFQFLSSAGNYTGLACT